MESSSILRSAELTLSTRVRDARFSTVIGKKDAVHDTLKRSLQTTSARKQKLQNAETIKNRENLKIRERFMKDNYRRQKQLKIREFFKEFMKFFPIRERFANFLLQEKVFAKSAKEKQTQP